ASGGLTRCSEGGGRSAHALSRDPYTVHGRRVRLSESLLLLYLFHRSASARRRRRGTSPGTPPARLERRLLARFPRGLRALADRSGRGRRSADAKLVSNPDRTA